jgi:membrane dipeptidase
MRHPGRLLGLACAVAAWGAGHAPAQMPADKENSMSAPAGPVRLTPRAREVLRGGILIDGHNDLPWGLRSITKGDLSKIDLRQPQPRLQTDIPRLRKGGLGAQFWAVYVPADLDRKGGATAMALEQFDLIHRMIETYPDVFELAVSADDVERIHTSGKIASLIGVEGGHMIEGSLQTLGKFHKRGARYLGLTHSESLEWADSATDEPRCGGLSPFGERVVRELNRLGMFVDLAHVSPDTMRAALRVSEAPVIASHSSAYAVAQHVRNVPDDVLRMIRDNGGVVMVNFFSGYSHPEGAKAMARFFETEREFKEKYRDPAEREAAWNEWKKSHPIPAGDAYMIVDHIDHLVRVAGIDHVGVGSDYDGVGKLPVQMEDVSGYPYLIQALLDRGYSEADIHKIMGGNLLRAMRQMEEVARRLKETP